MNDPYDVIAAFEQELCAYTGADFAIAVDSCTNALQICCEYLKVSDVTIPKYTYRSVPMAILRSGGRVFFDDRKWRGCYSLDPYPVIDSARRFRANMYSHVSAPHYVCVSFHYTKILRGSIGGAILHNDAAADRWLRRYRHDGRTDGLSVHDDPVDMIGMRCHITPEVAGDLRKRLRVLPSWNHDVTVPPGHYPDLSQYDWNGIYDRQRSAGANR